MNRSSYARVLSAVFLVSLFVSAAASAAVSSDDLWRDVSEQTARANAIGERFIFPRSYRVIALNVDAFHDLAAIAPMELTYGVEDISPVMTLPMPDGTFSRFRIQESQIMAPELAIKLPDVKTYRGQGIDDPTASARLDFTPMGFHGFVRSAQGAVYIDPFVRGNTVYYLSYWQRDYSRPNGAPFRCDFAEANPDLGDSVRHIVSGDGVPATPPVAEAATGATLRTYRLALAATGEYTQFHGGTVPGAQAAMVTTMNRVNGIYEIDVAVRMIMVDNTTIVFTNALTDPYSNTSSDLPANQTTITTRIGSANYDIGHLFGTGGGGIATLGCVCSNSIKARGLTGSSSPIGDAFDVDYVAHEMGHQFGGRHTFNGTTGSCGGGNRDSSAAYEPGSGTTIMAYAGICGSENLQSNSDPYFHVKSLDEIAAFVSGSGNSCAVQTSTGNTAPTVNAGAAITIPRSTPFYLTGSATDATQESLTYCWEEFDLGTASPPNDDSAASRPIFRSFNPTTSGVRTFPKLPDLLNNTTTIGESLPTRTRTMTFRLTARDNATGGGGVNYASTTVSVTNTAGPFTVTAPNTAVSWTGGSTQTVTWNVANTTASPVSCASVKIQLSTDGGVTFPNTILASTPNDGAESITVPNTPTTSARIRVECATSPFFDLSNANFTILAQPLTVIATATSTTSVDVTWTTMPDAVSYEIYRKAAGGSFTLLDTVTTTTFTDNTVTANNAYLYAAKWLDASSVASALSTPDLATTFVFTDDPLVPQSTPIKAIHITELRTAIDAVRDLASLSAFSYTDPTITPGVTPVKAVHLTELRTALNAARSALSLPTVTYTDSSPVAGVTLIKAVHVSEVRAGVE